MLELSAAIVWDLMLEDSELLINIASHEHRNVKMHFKSCKYAPYVVIVHNTHVSYCASYTNGIQLLSLGRNSHQENTEPHEYEACIMRSAFRIERHTVPNAQGTLAFVHVHLAAETPLSRLELVLFLEHVRARS